MDQEAFRQLVSSSSTISPSASSSRSFGKTPKRAPTSTTTNASSSTSSTKSSDLKPRKLSSNYIDRASARRSGHTSSEFNDIESLHRDFEERIAAAETEQERQTLREQISSVGGDARYSVLVKGLDWALLAQNRARIEKEKDGGEGAEGELEEAYQEGRAEQSEGKRSREQIVEAIKRRREGKSKAEGKEDAAEKKFRPIGFKPIGVAGESTEQETAEYKWVNGKRMRKKRRAEVGAESSVTKDENEARELKARGHNIRTQGTVKTKPPPNVASGKAEPSRTTVPAQDIPAKAEKGHSDPPTRLVNTASFESTEDRDASTEPSIAPEPKNIPAAAPHHPDEDDEDDDDDDIFADVGGWDGIPSPNDDDTEELQNNIEPALAPISPADRAPSPPAGPAAAAPPESTSSPIDTTAPAPSSSRPQAPVAPMPEPAFELHPPQQISPTVPDPPSHAPISAPSAEPPKLKKKSKWDDDDDISTKKKKKKRH
ncbi:RED_N domain-containing protein [Pseudozyma hubeiensis]|nr:RED_N domain-containing protein [Pseudozyma hubeiensis]